jgi:hypothetical protein
MLSAEQGIKSDLKGFTNRARDFGQIVAGPQKLR